MKNKASVWEHAAAKVADRVLARAAELDSASDAEVAAIVGDARRLIGESPRDKHAKMLDQALVDVYAAVCAASKRTLGMSPYKVQIIGAIALHQGHIAEAKTGEGKTLMAAMPSALHACCGRGVHVVTVNPYLARRDADNIGRIHAFLGLVVGCVVPGMTTQQRQEAYGADITYVSNTELGFDWLRDNMATAASGIVQRDLVFAIVDEADSILIDEAKTPLIIAGHGEDVAMLYNRVNAAVCDLREGAEDREFNKAEAYLGIERKEEGDYIVHEKQKNVTLTPQGMGKLEAALGIEDLSAEKNRRVLHVVTQCLRAHGLFRNGKDYVVRPDRRSGKPSVQLVDEHTGRIMDGRQYSDGLHQAIEAKEGVEVSTANQTVATTTYQNFFRKYETLSGMTGTAATERRELRGTYGLSVKVIPTNRPMIRVDEPDRIYLRAADKRAAIVGRVREAIAQGRPVLIGTASVSESEAMSHALACAGIDHQVLNAKQDAHEAEIVALAGVHGTVTVATDMAGRGTDIMLDDESRAAGGLLVIGSEKHESARIDNQLRGRAGRQGDPGTSAFYCSCEDRVMRLYGSDRFKKIIENSELDTHDEIRQKTVMRNIVRSQRRVELDNFAQRRDTLEYDDVNDMQRERIYAERRMILAKESVTAHMVQAVRKCCACICDKGSRSDWKARFFSVTGIEADYPDAWNRWDAYRCSRWLGDIAVSEMMLIAAHGGIDDSYMRKCMLIAIDSAWAEQLKALEFARDAVSYMGYGQLDPKASYAHEAYRLYADMQANIYTAATFTFFRHRPDSKGEVEGADGTTIKLKSGKDMQV